MRSNCTMLFGSIETVDERVDHLLRLRGLQDETGGFQTFIPLKFHNENNRLHKLPEPTDADCLQTIRGEPVAPRQHPARQGLLADARRAARASSRWGSGSTTSTAPCARSASTTWPAPRRRRSCPATSWSR
jgi:2-iminoacetate synthase ThiH